MVAISVSHKGTNVIKQHVTAGNIKSKRSFGSALTCPAAKKKAIWVK
jgi:hypothetical protein